jgi:hypothetical protein
MAVKASGLKKHQAKNLLRGQVEVEVTQQYGTDACG